MERIGRFALLPALLTAGLFGCASPGGEHSSTTSLVTEGTVPSAPTVVSHPAGVPPVPAAEPSAVETRPTHEPSTLAEALALRDSGRLDEAEKALVRAALAQPRSCRVRVNLARVRMSLGDGRGALVAADEALGALPGSVEALHQKGRALAALDRGAEAIAVLQGAREAAPEHGYVANTLGWLLLTRGDAAGAVPHLEAAREVLPGLGYVRNNLGVAYERIGRGDEALVEYRAAVAAGDSGGKAGQSLARLGAEADATTAEVLAGDAPN